MKKNILITILLLLTIISWIIAFIKADESTNCIQVIQEVEEEAEANYQEAKRQSEIAQMRVAEATAAQAEAEKLQAQLASCQTR